MNIIITTVRQHLAEWVDVLSEHLDNRADWLDPLCDGLDNFSYWLYPNLEKLTKRELIAIVNKGFELGYEDDTYLAATLIAQGRADFVSGIEAAKKQIEDEKRGGGAE